MLRNRNCRKRARGTFRNGSCAKWPYSILSADLAQSGHIASSHSEVCKNIRRAACEMKAAQVGRTSSCQKHLAQSGYAASFQREAAHKCHVASSQEMLQKRVSVAARQTDIAQSCHMTS